MSAKEKLMVLQWLRQNKVTKCPSPPVLSNEGLTVRPKQHNWFGFQ
jgi:hypothetical protein